MYSVHVRVKFTSKNGYSSYENGYSKFDNWSSYSKAFENAVFNGAYSHIYKGGNYSWTYDNKTLETHTITLYRTKKTRVQKRKEETKVLSKSEKIELRKKVLSKKKEQIAKKKRVRKEKSIEGTMETKQERKKMYKQEVKPLNSMTKKELIAYIKANEKKKKK